MKRAKSELPKNIWSTISAFCNTAGGWLVLGVEQLGKEFVIRGVENTEKLEQDLLNTLRGSKFNVKLLPQCKKYKFQDKTVLAFYFSVSNKKPIYFSTPANTFIRTGSGDQRATNEEIDAMFRDQAFGTRTNVATELTISDLYLPSLARYRDYLARFNPSHRYNRLSQDEILTKLQIINEDKLTLAGLLAFGKLDSIQKHFADFRIDLLEIPGTSYSDAKVRYNYRLEEQENLWEYYFALFDRLRMRIGVPFKLGDEGFAVEDAPQLEAIREALVNMLMHSDYFSPGKARIRIFDDRLEFFNPGGLPLSFEKLMQMDASMPRNPILAKIFRAVKLAENAGFGFDKMIEGWKKFKGIEPVFSTDFVSTTTCFSLDKPRKDVGKDVGKETMEVLLSIKKNPRITIPQLAEINSVAERTIERHISKLKTNKLIKRIGGRKNGYWEVL